MDKSIVAIEQSHLKADYVASTSKSFGLVKINSIAIDLNSTVDEMETPDVHEQFSIRGFVAGMRKKDIRMCYPFTTPESGVGNFEENLPSLSVPSFRWWQCSHCVPEISVERGTLAMVVSERVDNADASASESVNRGKDGLSLLKDIVNLAGNRHGSIDLVVRADQDPSNTIPNLRICDNERQKATFCSRDKSDCQNSHADTSRTNPFQNSKTKNNSAGASNMLAITEQPFSRVNGPENVSSASDGTLNALPRRRKTKLRSLADIIMEERNPPTENRRPVSASSSGVQTTSTDSELPLQVPSDIGKGIKIPQAKRKFVFEEETGSQGNNYPSGSIKRLKGKMQELESSTSRRVESSNLESRGDALARMNSEHWSKSPLTNVKKRKAFDTGKKIRQNQIENGKVAIKEFPKVNSTCSGSFKKHDVSVGSSFSRPRGMAPYFKGSLSGQQMDTMSSLSKSKRPENEANHKTLIPPRKSNVGDFNDKGKAALDLLVNSFASYERNSSSRPDRGIPDLNETFTHNTSAMRGKQLPTLSENVLPVNKNLDISASSKATIREGKRPISEQQTLQKVNNNVERGSSEDIPMEIVELLAKNKLENSRKRLWPDHGINNNSLTPPNGRYPDPHPTTPNFPALPNRSGQTVANVNNRIDKTYPLSFPHPNKPQLDMGKLDDTRFSLFHPFPQTQSFSQQKKTPYPTSTSKMSVPGGGSDPFWPPRQPNVPFHLTIPQNQNHPFQANSSILSSFSNGSHKGKTVSDIKGSEEKRSVNDPFMPKERQNWPNMDPYSNDAIPAMQLLSLMDHRIASGSSLKMGPPKNFMNKTFAPCNNHPPVNRSENQNVFNGLFVSQNGHYKELLESCYGVTPLGEKNTSSYFHRQIPHEQGNSKGVHMAGPSSIAIGKARGKSPLRVCSLNRNPADFSIPDATNEFTISSKDLKLRKKSDVKGKSRSVNLAGQKKQRPRKDVMGKEYSSK